MSDSNQRIAGIEAAEAEVELSAEDLLGLSAPGVSSERPGAATDRPRQTTAKSVAPARRRTSATGVALSFVLAVGAVGAVYVAMTPGHPTNQNVQLPPSQLPASSPKSEGKPVLFANPFDANEVFEFPAGTSEAEARDAVAGILMERAMERQRKYDARVSSNH